MCTRNRKVLREQEETLWGVLRVSVVEKEEEEEEEEEEEDQEVEERGWGGGRKLC